MCRVQIYFLTEWVPALLILLTFWHRKGKTGKRDLARQSQEHEQEEDFEGGVSRLGRRSLFPPNRISLPLMESAFRSFCTCLHSNALLMLLHRD